MTTRSLRLLTIIALACIWIAAVAASGAEEGKKNTDKWFPIKLVDSTDLYTDETGVASGDTTVQYAYEGATSWSTYADDANTWKEVGNGVYWLQIGASEFTSEGKYVVRVSASGCHDYEFVVEVRDSTLAEAIDAVGTITAKLPSKSYLTGTANSDGDVQADEATGNFPGSVASVAGAVGSVTGAVGSVTGSVASVTGNVGGNVTGSIGSLAAQAQTDVQTSAAAALTAYDPPTNAELEARTLLAAAYFDPATDKVYLGNGAHGGAAASLTLADYGDFRATGFSTLDAAGVRTAVGLAAANLDTQLADLPTVAEFEASTLLAADYFVVGDYTAPLDAAGTRTALGLAAANLDTQFAAAPGLVWSEAIPGLYGTGTAGYKLNAAGGAGDPWSTVLGTYGDGTAGAIIYSYVNASIAAVKAKTDLISADTVTVASPVAASGEVTVFRGDDYADADGRALTFTVSDYSGPSLAGATTTMALVTKANYERGALTSALSVTCTVTGTTTLTIKAELTAAQTAALASNPSSIYTYYYQVRSTTAAPASRKITLAQDKLIVRPRIAE